MTENVSSRQHLILEQLLENRNGLSVDALAATLGISRTAVQRHFAVLEKDGYIRKNTYSKTAGRPAILYAITDKGIECFPKQYAWFSELILSELQQEIGPEQFKGYMRRLGAKLADSIGAEFAGKDLDSRLQGLIAVMTRLGFQARTNKDSDTGMPIIQASNCIYHELAQKHHAVCEFDLALMSSVLEKDIKHTRCMAKGDCVCSFSVHEKQPATATGQ